MKHPEFCTADIGLAAFLKSHSFKLGASLENGFVVFTFRDSPSLRKLVESWANNELSMVRPKTLLDCFMDLRIYTALQM